MHTHTHECCHWCCHWLDTKTAPSVPYRMLCLSMQHIHIFNKTNSTIYQLKRDERIEIECIRVAHESMHMRGYDICMDMSFCCSFHTCLIKMKNFFVLLAIQDHDHWNIRLPANHSNFRRRLKTWKVEISSRIWHSELKIFFPLQTQKNFSTKYYSQSIPPPFCAFCILILKCLNWIVSLSNILNLISMHTHHDVKYIYPGST